MIVAVEAASHGGGGHSVGIDFFADDFVGISETPEGLQKQNREGTIEHTRKRRVAANVRKVRSRCMERQTRWTRRCVGGDEENRRMWHGEVWYARW